MPRRLPLLAFWLLPLGNGCSSGQNDPASAVGPDAGADSSVVTFDAQGMSGSTTEDTKSSFQLDEVENTLQDGASGDGRPRGPTTLPADFTKGTLGGYKLGSPPAAGEQLPNNGGDCGSILTGVVRDFPAGHPDFEDYCCGDRPGLVANRLGPDRKPVYVGDTSSGAPLTTGADEFNQWYRSVEGANQPFLLSMFFERSNTTDPAVYTFQSDLFFPLDNQGFGNEWQAHNFHFTTEVHTSFRYRGGEVFQFRGDDDVWVFINNQLVIDLGGVHGALDRQVELDERATELGLTKGQSYPLDLFHAERHTSQSNFRIDTTLEFTNCGELVPDIILR